MVSKIFILSIYILFGENFNDIDYNNKLIVKTLQKYGNAVVMQELDIRFELDEDKGKFFSLSGNELKNGINYLYVGRVNSCRSGGCSTSGMTENFDFEYFDYFILFNQEGSVVQVKIFNYQATKGQEITASWWLKQFNEYNGAEELVVGKQIDGISGATISALSITHDITYNTKLLKKYIQPVIEEIHKF